MKLRLANENDVGKMAYFSDVDEDEAVNIIPFYLVLKRVSPCMYRFTDSNGTDWKLAYINEEEYPVQSEPPTEGQTITNAAGGKQSFTKARFDAIPPIVLRLLAQCLGFGLRKYGQDNWKQIPKHEHIAHAMNHINEWQLGDRSEPHLVNAMARLSFALWWAVEDGEQAVEYVHPEEQKQ